ncbi:MAG: zf-HC2 domain-containing protein [Clostridia bacterium]|nr:zf-HC2 domain-containing protein [Clostridia bacterium]
MKEIDCGCDVIRDLLPLYVDGVCSDASRALVEAHLVECEDCRRLFEAMGTQETLNEPVIDEKRLFRRAASRLLAIVAALAVIIACFAVNLGGAWMGGPATVGQFAATIGYIVFWGVFCWAVRRFRTLVKFSLIMSAISFVGALWALICRLTDSGWILDALLTALTSVPFYGLRWFLGWDETYAAAAVISAVWLAVSIILLRRLKKDAVDIPAA